MPPIAVNVPANPITDDMPVLLAAADPLVLATPCLEWVPFGVGAAAAQVAVPHWRMLRASHWVVSLFLGVKCTFDDLLKHTTC